MVDRQHRSEENPFLLFLFEIKFTIKHIFSPSKQKLTPDVIAKKIVDDQKL